MCHAPLIGLRRLLSCCWVAHRGTFSLLWCPDSVASCSHAKMLHRCHKIIPLSLSLSLSHTHTHRSRQVLSILASPSLAEQSVFMWPVLGMARSGLPPMLAMSHAVELVLCHASPEVRSCKVDAVCLLFRSSVLVIPSLSHLLTSHLVTCVGWVVSCRSQHPSTRVVCRWVTFVTRYVLAALRDCSRQHELIGCDVHMGICGVCCASGWSNGFGTR